MTSKSLYKCITLVVLLCITCGTVFPAHAEEQTPFTGIDVIFIIDQSGSMGGTEAGSFAHPTPNDPSGWRFYALVAGIKQLGGLLWNRYPNYMARVGVIEYGTHARVAVFDDLPNGYYPIQAKTEQDWLSQEADILKAIEEYRETRSVENLGFTNPVEAFVLAKTLFGKMSATDNSRRIKLIIHLTDGIPCIPDEQETGCIRTTQELTTLKDRTLPENYPADQDYFVYVVGINDSEGNYWLKVAPYWEAIAKAYDGEATKVSNPIEIGTFFGETLSNMLRLLPLPGSTLPPVPVIPERIESGYYSVQPYLQSITFSIFKSVPEDWISIEENGTPLEVNGTDKSGRIRVTGNGTDTLFGQITVLQPKPGKWLIQKPKGSDVIVEVQGIPFDPQLISPIGNYTKGIPALIQFNLIDRNGQFPLQYDDKMFDLDVTATITNSEGQVSLPLITESPGIYTGLFAARSEGEHTLHIVAKSRNPDGNEVLILDQDAGTFIVGPLIASLTDPIGDIYQNVPSRLAVKFTDPSGELIRESDTPGSELDVQVVLTVGNQNETVKLPRESNGIYALDYVPPTTGLHEARLVVSSTDTTGTKAQLIDQWIGRFEVKPTKGLNYVILEPQDGKTSYIRPWWLFPITTLEVEVRIVDPSNSNQPVEITQVVQGQPDQAFAIKVTDPSGRDRSSEFTWNVRDGGRTLVASGTQSSQTGFWQIEVGPNFSPKPGFALLNRDLTLLKVTRAEHYLAISLDGFILLLIVATIIYEILRCRALKRLPLPSGVLSIRDADGMPIWSVSLRTLGTNRYVFSLGWMPPRCGQGRRLPPVASLKLLIITRPPGQEEAILVSGIESGKRSLQSSRLVFGSQKPFSNGTRSLHYNEF